MQGNRLLALGRRQLGLHPHVIFLADVVAHCVLRCAAPLKAAVPVGLGPELDRLMPAPVTGTHEDTGDRIALDVDHLDTQNRARLRHPDFDGCGFLRDAHVFDPGARPSASTVMIDGPGSQFSRVNSPRSFVVPRGGPGLPQTVGSEENPRSSQRPGRSVNRRDPLSSVPSGGPSCC